MDAAGARRWNWFFQRKEMHMLLYLLIWRLVGGLTGWVATLIMKTDAGQGVFPNMPQQ